MKDLSHLPTEQKAEGNPPDAKPYFSHLLAEAWADTLDDGTLEMADERARMRHSWAGSCARQLGYRMTGVEETNPIDVADRWRFGLGKIVHEQWQVVLEKAFPEAEIEKKVFIEESQSAGHIDAVVGDTTLELKTINGFGFKMAVGARGAAEGPRTSAVLQGALNGLAVNAERVVIVDLSLELLSPRELEKLPGEPHPWRKFAAEWTYPREQYEPLAKAEVARFAKIIGVVDEGKLPPRAIPIELPPGARIVNPETGNWQVVNQEGMITDTGSHWGCNYCGFQKRCAADMVEGK